MNSGQPAVTAEERWEMIAQAGFSEDPLVDWLEAEREIDAMLEQRGALPAGKTGEVQTGTRAQG